MHSFRTVPQIVDFAHKTLKPALRAAPGQYPLALFQELAGFGLPVAAGGAGASAQDIFAAARALVFGSANLGFAVGWLAHTQMARHFIMAHGTNAQKSRWLPELASGSRMGAMAMSELKAGAHPKYLTTRATKTDGGFIISGEKAYTTNGPLAGLYAILAITDETGGRKRYGVFLTPRETPGLEVTESGHVDFLSPAKHGGLRLQNCFVPDDALLGSGSDGYEKMARPLRAAEDSFGIATRLGAIDAQIAGIIRAAETKNALSDIFLETLGRLSFLVESIGTLGRLAVDKVGEHADAVPLVTAARALMREAAKIIAELSKDLQDVLAEDVTRLQGDLEKAQNVARSARLERERQEGRSRVQAMTHLPA